MVSNILFITAKYPLSPNSAHCNLLSLHLGTPAFSSAPWVYVKARKIPDPEVLSVLRFSQKKLEEVIISISAPAAAPRVCSRPREMCSMGQALCNRLKESVTNVTWPGNQWHGVGNESCDGRGRPSQLLSLCVHSGHSLHPGSCRDLRGVLSAEASVAPGALLNRGKPTGAFS